MQNEITIPDNYTGTLDQENNIVMQINNALFDLSEQINNIPDEKMVFEKHITDFENYKISAYFSNNKKHAEITIEDSYIQIKIDDNIVKVDLDGNVI